MHVIEAAKLKFGRYKDVAEYLGISQQHLHALKTGERKITPFHAAKLADAIGSAWYEQVLPSLADRAETQEEERYWRGKLSELLKTGAKVLLITAGIQLVLDLNNFDTAAASSVGSASDLSMFSRENSEYTVRAYRKRQKRFAGQKRKALPWGYNPTPHIRSNDRPQMDRRPVHRYGRHCRKHRVQRLHNLGLA